MKTIRLWAGIACVLWNIASFAQVTQQVTAIQYYFNSDPGVGIPGNGAVISVTPTDDLDQTFSFPIPGSFTGGFQHLYVRAKDEYGRWSLPERRMFYVTDLTAGTRNIVSYQYFFDSDPGTGLPGNGAVVPVASTADYNATVAIALPALSNGFHQLYIRAKDDQGRWSIAERRMFYITDLTSGTRNIVAYQYFIDTDAGVGVTGNGAVVPVTSTADYNATVAIALPSLSNGFHQLYVRAKDDLGRWSIAERRMFYVTDLTSGTRNIVAYQYFFNTDAGVGVSGNGAVVPVTSTADYNATIPITLPALSEGFHQLYIRTKDDLGRWSLAERRMFFVSNLTAGTRNIVAYQYFMDNDPGVGLPGNGAVVPVTSTADLSIVLTLSITGLNEGIHQLYIRTKDDLGRWSIAERRIFYVTELTGGTKDLVTLEYYIDTEPGVRNANPYSIVATGDFDETIVLGVPCLAVGTHYLYIRAKDTSGRWSIAERDTFTVTSGVAAAEVTPAGPVSICSGNTIILSTTPVPGVTYQWVESGTPIGGETSPTLTITAAGDYALRSYCGPAFTVSNTVTVSVLPLLTYYADADTDGYGNAAVTTMACTAPSGYVTNDDDCNDADMTIHPNAPESCNLTDDDCDMLVDEGVQTIYYADADTDGYGNPAISQLACAAPSGYVSNDEDCDDGAMDINPAASETCNLIDDDCDGLVDEGVQTQFFADSDSDGFGNAANSILACTQPSGYVLNDDDCNDGNMLIHPNGSEICNGQDDDCDGLTDDADPFVTGQSTWYEDADGDGYGDAAVSVIACATPAGFVSNEDDCNDADMDINPGETEICNGEDDDCDGLTDDADPSVLGQVAWYMDADTDGFGDPLSMDMSCFQPAGYVANNDDCDDTDMAVNPIGSEVCNTIDDDCDGLIDEGVQFVFYADADYDGFGNPSATVMACTAPPGYVSDDTDCDDVLYYVYPGAPELCNGEDDDCDGDTDEGFDYSVAASSISSTNGSSFCLGDNTILDIVGGNLGTDAEWRWYEGGCGSGASIGSGTTLPVTPTAGIHTYFVRAEGTCNASACVFISITVHVPPSISVCPSDIYSGNDITLCGALKNYSVVSSGSPTPTLSYEFTGATLGSGSGTGSGSTFNFGLTSISIIGANSCGVTECTFDVAISDTEDPMIVDCPDPMEAMIEEGQWGAHVTWVEPSVTDNCGLLSLTSDFTPGDFFIVGSTTVNYTAVDIHGNATTCSFTVTINPPLVPEETNVSIFANDISFSDPNPDPGDTITLSAVVHNTSSAASGSFVCRLLDQFSETYYTDIVISGLEGGQSTTLNWTFVTPTGNAFVPMQVTIDDLNTVFESNELDNQAIRPYLNGNIEFGFGIQVVPDATPDAPAGSVIFLCGSAHYFGTAVPLEDTSVAGAQVKITVLETQSVLYGTTNSNGEYCVKLKTSNTPGLYHYAVEVTDFTLIGDSTGTFFLTDPICNVDLGVSIHLIGPFLCGRFNPIVAGSSLTGVVTVVNDCQEISIPTVLYIDLPEGTPVPGPFSIPALAPWESYSVTLPAMTFNIVGTTNIRAIVDYYDEVDEIYETNNTAIDVITVYPNQPDLAPSDAGSSLYQCDNPGINFTVDNLGGAATGNFTASMDMYRGATYEATLTGTFGSIPGRCSGVISFELPPVELEVYTFILHCDMENTIAELSEMNNDFTHARLFRICGPDLIVVPECGEIDVKPVDPVAGGTLTITATIWNMGVSAVTLPFEVGFDVEGTIYTATVNPPMDVNTSKTVSVTAIAPPHGDNEVIITADVNEAIFELREGNNAKSESLGWDFELTNIIPCAEKVKFAIEGSHSLCKLDTIQTRLYNWGVYEASNLKVKFEIDGPGYPSGWNNLGTITTYADRTCVCPLAIVLSNNFIYPQTGTYTFRITVDPLDLYIESNEDNNQILVSVNVSGLPDYAVYSQYIAPSLLNPEVNEVVSFNLSYKNIGCSGNETSELFLTADTDPVDSLTVLPLATDAFNTYALSQTWSSSLPGLHILRANIDHDSIVDEADEMNNEATRAILVGVIPDFRINSLLASVPSPVMGEIVTLTTLISNEGGIAADGVLRLYVKHGLEPEQQILEQPIQLLGLSTLEHTFQWIVTDPMAVIIARVEESDPLEFDFSDNEKQYQFNPISFSLAVINVPCAELSMGSIEISINGGSPPYFVQWSNGYTGQSIDIPSGIYSMTLTDARGTLRIGQDTVMDLALPVTWYVDADNDGYGNPDAFDYACEQPAGYTGSGTDCNDSNPSIYPDAPELPDGYDNDCDGQVDEGINMLDVDAGDCELVYFGYEPGECHTLSVSVNGGTPPFTYLWSNGATTPSTAVCPEETTIYTVVVTDHNGFIAEDNVTVQVIDVHCGNNNNKVVVCHIPPGNPENAQIICIAPSAIQAHLDHGCYIGICDAPDPCAEQGQPSAVVRPIETTKEEIVFDAIVNLKDTGDMQKEIVIHPNPVNDYFLVYFPQMNPGCSLTLFDISGRQLQQHSLTETPFSVLTGDLAEGMYWIQIKSSNQVKTKGFVVAH